MDGAVAPSPKPTLTIDVTTAHVVAAREQADALLEWFHEQMIVCVLRRGAEVTGLDLIDFGDPTPARERRIRKAFVEWLERNP
jgi:hypothetical protein